MSLLPPTIVQPVLQPHPLAEVNLTLLAGPTFDGFPGANSEEVDVEYSIFLQSNA